MTQRQVERLFVPNMRTMRQVVGRTLDTPKTQRWHELIYFDTAHPSLPFGGFVRASRPLNRPGESPSSQDAVYQIELSDGTGPAQGLGDAARLSEVPGLVRDRFGAERLGPRFGVRFQRRRFELGGLDLTVDRKVSYFSLVGDPLLIGTESSPRIRARSVGRGRDTRRLSAWLESLPIAPFTTKKWMGYHFFKQFYEVPRHNELPGFEYELKLAVDRVEIDVGRLPFPVLEVHQSDSLRGYYARHRACIRGDRAHTVEKGPATHLRGVLKRPERKVFDLVPWELPSPEMVMRRYKREVNVLNPDTLRVYTISIHRCEAGATMQQVEIEYDGVLVPDAASEMARFSIDHDPEHLLTLARAADDLGFASVARGLVDRYRRHPASKKGALPLPETFGAPSRSPSDARSIKVPRSVEDAVVEDMLLIRDALIQRYGFRPTTKSKRKWLTELRGARRRSR